MKTKDVSGVVYGRLTAVKRVGTKWGMSLWECLCSCGNTKTATLGSLAIGNVTSCGCAHRDHLEGQKFGRLTVIRFSGVVDSEAFWECSCECGGAKTTNSERLKNGGTKSCGCLKADSLRAVGALARASGSRRGVNGARYRHDLLDADREPRQIKSWEYRQWRTAVYQRDDYTCQCCYKNGARKNGGLAAHHIESWDHCPEKRYEVDNGITFCSPCHHSFHNQFGRGKNTRAQLDEFMSTHQKHHAEEKPSDGRGETRPLPRRRADRRGRS